MSIPERYTDHTAIYPLNQTTNTSINTFAKKKFLALQIILPITFVLAIAGVIVNSLICYAIIKKKELHTPTYYLMINMAISDALITIFTSLVTAIHYYLSYYVITTPLLVAACKITCFVDAVAFASSTLTLTAIAIERYYKILPSSSYKTSCINSSFKLKSTIGFTWMAGIIVAIPYLVFVDIVPENPWICSILYLGPSFNKPYFITLLILIYVIPNILIIYFYARIIHYLGLKKISQINLNQAVFKNNRKAQINTIKMLILVTIGFMCTSLPIFAAYIIIAYSGLHMVDYLIHVNNLQSSIAQIAFIMVTISCCQNPLIYIYYNQTIRKTLSKSFRRWYKIFTAKFCCTSSNQKLSNIHLVVTYSNSPRLSEKILI